ncbi:hypothetical protein KQX54_021552 [Cotesia glomerata]|uniref:Uncharacterized protein n=1 Tax=Cotesia glomerata TaxID=32391 RepID=A0AAV7J8W3_COTGL|nr:hypothetical protein KQX54_021552 [Cotesia glomerata]
MLVLVLLLLNKEPRSLKKRDGRSGCLATSQPSSSIPAGRGSSPCTPYDFLRETGWCGNSLSPVKLKSNIEQSYIHREADELVESKRCSTKKCRASDIRSVSGSLK